MRKTDQFPTVFAQRLGEKVGLLFPRKNGMDHAKHMEAQERMQYFQQMAVTSKFEDCILSYIDIPLSDTQIESLKIIHQSTKPWITGHIVGELMNRIGSERTGNKDIAEAVRVLAEQAKEPEHGRLTGKMQGIVVKSTQTEINQQKRKTA
jgi:hypothetical protein